MFASHTIVASMVSRRVLIGTGSAVAIVCGLGGWESTANGRPETNRAGGAVGVASDRRLSPAFREKAYGFYHAAKASQVRLRNDALYPIAIAIELSLKAYLLHRGICDWNRTHITHDLHRAVTCAEGAGFRQTPGGLADVASSPTPYSERRALHWRAPEIMAPAETAKHSWMARSRREDAHA